MTLRFPFVSIQGADGVNIVPQLGRDFIGVQITDLDGGEGDECLIRIRRTKPYRQAPAKDTDFRVLVGWDETGALMTGSYRFQRVIYSGDPDTGEEMGLVCRASADALDALKRVDSEHFDEETGHKTYGDVLRTLADRAGLGAAIDPEIAKIPLAGGYLLRWKQSSIGLATELADELGAIVKPQAGRLTVRRRGSGLSASGQRLRMIVVPKDPSYAFQADIEPQYGFGAVASTWFDGSTGRPTDILKQLATGAALLALPHLANSQAYASAITAAASQRLAAETATATFEMLGNAEAVAGAPLQPEGFGPDIDGVAWKATTVFHDIGPERGWVTTVQAENSDE